MNIQLLKASDFNEKLRERGAPKSISVQKICKTSKNEKEVRDVLSEIWNAPESSEEILSRTIVKNKEVFDFEQMLVETGKMQ